MVRFSDWAFVGVKEKGGMRNLGREKVEGQKAWMKAGVELSQQEASELKSLKDRLRGGGVLTYLEQDRLTLLQRKQITTSRIVDR